jgi:hypothetical protein
MKTITAALSLLMFAGVAAAQSPDPSKWMCRNLADSGGFTYQGESIFGTQACRPIAQTSVTQRPVTTPPNPVPVAQPTAASAASEEKPGKATVVLYRPSRFIDASRKATIYVDNRPLCVLTNNTSVRFEIPTGMHSLATLFNRQTAGETALPESQFNFVANQTYYFTLTNNWLIFAVSNQKGESESSRTKPLKEGNISVQPIGNELN